MPTGTDVELGMGTSIGKPPKPEKGTVSLIPSHAASLPRPQLGFSVYTWPSRSPRPNLNGLMILAATTHGPLTLSLRVLARNKRMMRWFHSRKRRMEEREKKKENY